MKSPDRFDLDAITKQKQRIDEAIKPQLKQHENSPLARLLISLPWIVVALVIALVSWFGK